MRIDDPKLFLKIVFVKFKNVKVMKNVKVISNVVCPAEEKTCIPFLPLNSSDAELESAILKRNFDALHAWKLKKANDAQSKNKIVCYGRNISVCV